MKQTKRFNYEKFALSFWSPIVMGFLAMLLAQVVTAFIETPLSVSVLGVAFYLIMWGGLVFKIKEYRRWVTEHKIVYKEDQEYERFRESLNPSKLAPYCEDVKYSNEQLEYIRKGITEGIDVSIYAHPDIPPQLMQEIYNALRGKHDYIIQYTRDNGVNTYGVHVDSYSKKRALMDFEKDNPNCLVISVNFMEETEKRRMAVPST